MPRTPQATRLQSTTLRPMDLPLLGSGVENSEPKREVTHQVNVPVLGPTILAAPYRAHPSYFGGTLTTCY
eukprot:964487-Amorphochlora_amoeboformis.AAC.1